MAVQMATGPVSRAGWRAWVGLAVLALPTLLISLDMSVLFLALPRLSADLHPTGTQTLWIMDSYGFMVAGFLITMGNLGDRIGRRRLLLTGAAVFGVTSVLAAYSQSAEMLIAARLLLGVAGATLMPSTMALISTIFTDPRQRATAISVWVACFMGGTVVGPLVGGTLLSMFWWGSAFLLGVPVMVLLLAVGPILLPEAQNPRAGRPDVASVALSLGAILPLMYGVKTLARDGVGTVPVAAILAGAALGAVFVRRQRRLATPLLDMRLFGRRSFTVALGVSMAGAVIMGGFFFLLSQHVQLVLGLSALGAGLMLVPGSISMAATSLLAPRLARRFGTTRVITAGLVVAAAGFLLFTQVGTGQRALLVVAVILLHVGMGPVPALGTDLIIGGAPPAKAGSAAAVAETSNELGIAIGVALLGSLGSVLYRGQLTGTMPVGVPGGKTGAVREGLAQALAVAHGLPNPTGGALTAAARAAFTTGLHTAAALGAVLFAVLAVVTAKVLRHPAETTAPVETADAVGTSDAITSVEAGGPAPAGAAEPAAAREAEPVAA